MVYLGFTQVLHRIFIRFLYVLHRFSYGFIWFYTGFCGFYMGFIWGSRGARPLQGEAMRTAAGGPRFAARRRGPAPGASGACRPSR